MRDGHVVCVVERLIDSLTGHAQLLPCGVESVVRFTLGRIVGDLVTDEHPHFRRVGL